MRSRSKGGIYNQDFSNFSNNNFIPLFLTYLSKERSILIQRFVSTYVSIFLFQYTSYNGKHAILQGQFTNSYLLAAPIFIDIKMVQEAGSGGGNSSRNQPTSSVNGGTSATPTPANNVDGGSGWGDKLWRSGENEGLGHADV
jgi:hypothetical protein